MKFFSGSSNMSLAQKVAGDLSISLSAVDTHIFPDGERRIRISEKVVGEHAFVLQSANTPVDTNYMELFFLIDALKRNGAEFVTAIVPYFGYQRQDHIFREGEAVSLEVVISILEKLGIDRLMSFDMHSVKIPDLFAIPVNHLSALPLFAKEIRELLSSRGPVAPHPHPTASLSLQALDEGLPVAPPLPHDAILVSPDMGGIARIKKISELLNGMPYVAVEKHRDLATGDIRMEGIDGVINGKKRAIIVDDMISSGNTVLLASEALLKSGIEEVYVFATHAVFSEEAPSALQNSKIKGVFVTDTVAISKEKQFAKLKILSVSGIIAEEIKKIENGK